MSTHCCMFDVSPDTGTLELPKSAGALAYTLAEGWEHLLRPSIYHQLQSMHSSYGKINSPPTLSCTNSELDLNIPVSLQVEHPLYRCPILVQHAQTTSLLTASRCHHICTPWRSRENRRYQEQRHDFLNQCGSDSLEEHRTKVRIFILKIQTMCNTGCFHSLDILVFLTQVCRVSMIDCCKKKLIALESSP